MGDRRDLERRIRAAELADEETHGLRADLEASLDAAAEAYQRAKEARRSAAAEDLRRQHFELLRSQLGRLDALRGEE